MPSAPSATGSNTSSDLSATSLAVSCSFAQDEWGVVGFAHQCGTGGIAGPSTNCTATGVKFVKLYTYRWPAVSDATYIQEVELWATTTPFPSAQSSATLSFPAGSFSIVLLAASYPGLPFLQWGRRGSAVRGNGANPSTSFPVEYAGSWSIAVAASWSNSAAWTAGTGNLRVQDGITAASDIRAGLIDNVAANAGAVLVTSATVAASEWGMCAREFRLHEGRLWVPDTAICRPPFVEPVRTA